MVKFECHGKTFKYCKESCQLFKKDHLIRRIAVWITEWYFYKFLTSLAILTMAIFMGMHNFVDNEEQSSSSIFATTKYVYIAYFLAEIILKLIARGIY